MDIEKFKNTENKEEIIFPESLTERDIELINKQCEQQHATSKEQIEGFARAYAEAKEIAHDEERVEEITNEEMEGLVLLWASEIESRNKKGFRTTPVYFEKSGQTGLDPGKIERAMETFIEIYTEHLNTGYLTQEEITQLYKQFEEVHPLEDGNGRLGHLLWALAFSRVTGEWPESLPPDVFNEHVEEN